MLAIVGRCVAAASNFNPVQLKQRFAALKWQSPPAFEEWLREIEAARANGFAVDQGNYIADFTIVAALVAGADQTQRAISIVAVSEQVAAQQRAALERDTREMAERVTARLRGLR